LRGLEERAVVRVEEQKEDHGDGHDVHIKEQNHAAVVEAPLEAEATHCVRGAGDGEDGGDGQLRICVGFGISGPDEGQHQAAEDQQGTAKERFLTEVQEARLVDSDWERGGDDYLSLAEGGQLR
jgi:hypothetical protein